MSREVVRNIGSNKTHVADVESSTMGSLIGKPYRRPDRATRALCGVSISDGVVMREGTKVRCSPCRYLDREGG